mmetsp:Transcript_13271/g.18505  ORF Transcript_13271/g.18505 Transcript_13271/m.18505 type:complete len:284 (+) Transcript_13271:87-938(+)
MLVNLPTRTIYASSAFYQHLPYHYLVPPNHSNEMLTSRKKKTSFCSTLLFLQKDRSSDSQLEQEGDQQNPIQIELKQERQQRQYGVIAGGSFMLLSSLLGCVLGLFDPSVLIILALLLIGFSSYFIESWNEYELPLEEDFYFKVQESTLVGAGNGLFAKSFIPSNTFLFEYTGEILSEDEYFARYPEGNGRYVAEIPMNNGFLSEPIYIDGVDPDKSGIARYINSQQPPKANLEWKKQSVGKQAGRMFFYSIQDIQEDQELFFDYGDNYWQVAALQQEEDTLN